MKKLLSLFFVCTAIFASCSGNKATESGEQTQTLTIEQENNIVKEYLKLYTKLMEFKGSNDFKKFGFGEGSPFKSWIYEVEKYKEEPSKTALLSHSLLPEELLQLGYEYVTSDGKETEVTKFFTDVYETALREVSGQATLNTANAIAPSAGKDEIIGKWKVSGGLTMEITIFTRGGKYYSHENNKDIELKRTGDKYYLQGK